MGGPEIGISPIPNSQTRFQLPNPLFPFHAFLSSSITRRVPNQNAFSKFLIREDLTVQILDTRAISAGTIRPNLEQPRLAFPT